MKIAICASEAAPYAKSGGLGDGLDRRYGAHAGHRVLERKAHKTLVFHAVELRKLGIGL